jgi:hypothetical protein
MSAPFQPGDVVACIDASPARWHEPKSEDLAIGDVFTVVKYMRGFPFGWGFPRAFIIRSCDQSATLCWDAYRFRKVVNPGLDVAARIKRCRPVRAKAPA